MNERFFHPKAQLLLDHMFLKFNCCPWQIIIQKMLITFICYRNFRSLIVKVSLDNYLNLSKSNALGLIRFYRSRKAFSNYYIETA